MAKNLKKTYKENKEDVEMYSWESKAIAIGILIMKWPH